MTAPAAQASTRWTTADLDILARVEGTREEIIEGELHMSSQPDWHHQETSDNFLYELKAWLRAGGSGKTLSAPGVIFDEENAVAPDVVWVSAERLAGVLGEDGKLHAAPDLAVEVLSPGARNQRRDQEVKLRLYSMRGVREYWIADWQAKTVEVYRRAEAALKLAATLYAEDELTSPLLPGFRVKVGQLFPG
jgi:Uma2 family endonuclease